MYYQSIQQLTKMLLNFQVIIDKAVAYAESKKFDIANLLNARLAPDQFPFTKQVQVFCDSAKFAGARLAGKEAPKHEDNEKTIEELKERINKVIGYLKEFNQDDFTGASDRKIELQFMPGKYITGEEYLVEFVIPNFYFHYCAAYSILRHNGLDIGKMDYIGSVNFKELK